MHLGLCLWGLRTTNVQTSLRIHAVGSVPLLFTYWKTLYLYSCYKRNFVFLASLCSWGDWFEYRLSETPCMHFCRSKLAYLKVSRSGGPDLRFRQFAKVMSRWYKVWSEFHPLETPSVGKERYFTWASSFHIYFQWRRLVTVQFKASVTGPRSAVGNVSGYRCEADCRSRGREFDPGPVPYFRGDWSWNNFYGHSPPFRWIIHEVTSESMCTITG